MSSMNRFYRIDPEGLVFLLLDDLVGLDGNSNLLVSLVNTFTSSVVFSADTFSTFISMDLLFSVSITC